MRSINAMRHLLPHSHHHLLPKLSPPPQRLLLPRASSSPCPKFLLKSSPLSRLPKPSSATLRSFRAASMDGPDRPSDVRAPHGEIHVIVGPMFAGKTTALLRRVRSEADNGRIELRTRFLSVALIKSNKDTRYGLDSIVTHDGVKMPCWALLELSTFRDKLGYEEYDKLDIIEIDEAQFFEDLFDFCCKAADNDGKTVIVAGLDGNYLRRRFGSVLDIIPIADSVTN